MEFWISSEAKNIHLASLRKVRNSIEDSLNSHLKEIGYKNDEIIKFRIVFIIRDDDFSAMREKEGVVGKDRGEPIYGVNIRIDHPSFRHADEAGRKLLIYKGIKKAVLLLGEKKKMKNLEPIIEYIEQQL